MNHFIERGEEFAKKAHEGQTRKTSGRPYILHPLSVAKILEEAGMPPEVIVAGLNHDTVEDTSVTIDEIRDQFGIAVASLVAFNTEDKTKTWEERKNHTVEQLKTGTLYEKALVVADKFANLIELIEMHESLGEEIWKCFKRGKEQQYWYFSNVAKSGRENLAEEMIPDFFKQYEKTVEDFFGQIVKLASKM